MEEHRLTEMPKDYDVEVFTSIYNDTKQLRRKLANNIDPSRYGVEREDILSWFDVKFIFIFTKYYGQVNNNILKGKIIQGLQFYKNRILRYSYTKKNSVNQTCDISEFFNIESHEVVQIVDFEDTFIDSIIPQMKSKLDSLAFQLFTIDYNPPLYILYRLEPSQYNRKIPDYLLCEFMGISLSSTSKQELLNARKRYKKVIASLI